MTAKLFLFCVLLLESISGAVCYDYDVGGMVASSLAAFIFILAIVILLIIAVLWRNWYMKRQARKGRYRIPREKWRPLRQTFVKKSGTVETPRSDRRMHMRMYNVAHMPSSKPATIDRQEPLTDAWLTRLPPANYYEEKSKTMDIGAEEENVIVTDVLPDTTQRNAYPPVTSQKITYQDTSNTAYVSYNAGTGAGAAQTLQMPQTTSSQPVSYEPYHVQVKMAESNQPAQQLSRTTHNVQQVTQTTRPAQQFSRTMQGTSGRDIYIQPIVPDVNPLDNQTAGVVVFDSDEEAGNIPARRQQSEDLVLF